MNSNYKTRKGIGAEQANQQLGELLNTWLTTQGPSPIFQTCASCDHMAGINQAAFCNLYKLVPPVETILQGCESHKDNEDIPF
jgi:hypothetical protein